MYLRMHVLAFGMYWNPYKNACKTEPADRATGEAYTMYHKDMTVKTRFCVFVLVLMIIDLRSREFSREKHSICLCGIKIQHNIEVKIHAHSSKVTETHADTSRTSLVCSQVWCTHAWLQVLICSVSCIYVRMHWPWHSAPQSLLAWVRPCTRHTTSQ